MTVLINHLTLQHCGMPGQRARLSFTRRNKLASPAHIRVVELDIIRPILTTHATPMLWSLLRSYAWRIMVDMWGIASLRGTAVTVGMSPRHDSRTYVAREDFPKGHSQL
jgi:hypothetical protein